MSKEFTRAEVAKHNKIDDLWIIIDGSVYDLSSFVFEHPGGESALLDHAGKDGTKAYRVVYNHEYPENVALLAAMKRGTIKDGSTVDRLSEADMLHADVGHAATSGPPHVLLILGAAALGGLIVNALFA